MAMVNFFDPNGNDKYIQDLSVDLGINVYSNTTESSADLEYSSPTMSSLGGGTTTNGVVQLRASITFGIKPYIVDINIGNIVGTPKITRYYNGSGFVTFDTPVTLKHGSNKILMHGREGQTYIQPSFDTVDTWSYDEVSVSIQELIGYTEILGTYTSANRLQNQQVGANALLTRNDASGRTLSTMPSGQVAVDDSNKNVATSWNIGGDEYTIVQTVSGMLADLDSGGNALGTFSQRKEERWLTNELGEEYSYYIDQISQSYTPTAPTGELKAERIASIGYPDIVDTHYGETFVYSRAIHPDPPPLITGFIESNTGYCEYAEGGTCTTNSLIMPDLSRATVSAVYLWSVSSATLVSNSDEDYAEVSTPEGDTNVNYTLTLTITEGEDISIHEEVLTHEKILAPIKIAIIDCTQDGTCEL